MTEEDIERRKEKGERRKEKGERRKEKEDNLLLMFGFSSRTVLSSSTTH
jgi:hypothetical protein